MKVSGVASPYHFHYVDGLRCLNEHSVPIFGHWPYHTSDFIQINHYYYKSQQDCEEKMRREYATPVVGSMGHELGRFYEQAGRKGDREASILMFSRKAAMFERLGPGGAAAEVRKRLEIDIGELLQRAARMHLAGRTAEAMAELAAGLRRVQAPALRVGLSRLHAAAGDAAWALRCMAQALLAAGDKTERLELYREFEGLYDMLGMPAQRDSILDGLRGG